MNASDIIFYTTPQGEVRIEVFFEDETFWLTPEEDCRTLRRGSDAPSTITCKEIFQSGELIRKRQLFEKFE